MSVLTAKHINERLKLTIDEPRSLVITPLLEPVRVLDNDSIDLRLGTFFLLPQTPPEPFLDPTEPRAAKRSHMRIHKPLGDYLVVPAHQTVLGATLEFIKLPSDLCGQILTKSSVARTFLVIETAPWIHPLYRGCLTLEIANVSNTPILLYPGFPIGQLILMELDEEIDEKQQLTSAYVGPIEPEAPDLKDPKEVLYRIGVEEYRNPHRPTWQHTKT
jgi:dCTP deaminase